MHGCYLQHFHLRSIHVRQGFQDVRQGFQDPFVADHPIFYVGIFNMQFLVDKLYMSVLIGRWYFF